MTHLIPPRRGEVLSNKGVGTTRLMEYLERIAENINEQEETDDTEDSIGVSPAALSALSKEIANIELELAAVGSNSVMLARVFKRLSDLELGSTVNNEAAIAALGKSTFDRRYALLVC